MILFEKENNGFIALVRFINAHYREKTISGCTFQFVYKRKVIEAKYDTMFESDNGEEMDSPEYEEYNAIAFENLKTHKLFEINYKNLPKELYCNGERIL